MNNGERYSPFTPGNPVPVELFVGRADKITEIIRCLKRVLAGKQENIFLSGERGIGKSSLAAFLSEYATTKLEFAGIHVFLGGVESLNDMIQRVFDKLLKSAVNQPWFYKISKLFGDYVKEVGLFNISISFRAPKNDLQELVQNFPEAVNNLIEKIGEDRKAILIVLDDINGLAEKPEFANWYKSFADHVATHYKEFPLFLMVTGLPAKRDRLAKNQPSLMRVFRVIEIEKLDDAEVREFFEKAFSSVGMKVDNTAMNVLLRFSSGLPVIMHEIGDAVFLVDEDGLIDEQDAFAGVVAAAERIGSKYLDPQVYRAIRSDRYKSILRKLGDNPISREFTKRDVGQRLSDEEKKVFHNFLRKMRELGIIESDVDRTRGSYRFVNDIYPIYIFMEARRRSGS